MGARDIRAEAGAGSKRAVDGQRLRLALDRDGLELLELEDTLGRAIRRLGDGDAVDRRRALQSRGGIDDVAGDDPFALLRTRTERDDRLPRADPDPYLQGQRGVLLVQLLDRLQQAQPRAHCPLRVVLVGDGRPEDRHHSIADELLDRPAVELELTPQERVVRADAGTDIFGIHGFRGGREADEVAEEDGDHLALLLERGRGPLG